MKINISAKYVGLVLVVLSIAMFFLLLSFAQSIQKLNQFLHKDCTLPDEICPFKRDIPWESSAGFAIDAIIFILGVLLVMTSRYPEPKEGKTAKTASMKAPKIPPNALKSLDTGERKIYETIKSSDAIFQSELVEKSGMSKVKITRILDKLEAKGLVERKRRGMTNVVVAKR